MFRKIYAVIIVAALLLQLVPAIGPVANAAGSTFAFPNESADVLQPRITTDERVTLQGTLNNVNPSTVSYSVFQIVDKKVAADPTDDQIGSTRLDQTSSVFIDGFNVTIFNLELFPGLNRVTFKGLQGGGEVTESIFIEYRNGPVFYNLTAQIDGSAFPIQETNTTVVHSTASKGKSSYDISITGNAPNAENVTVIVNGSSKTYNVNANNNSSFVASPINLKKGKNLVTIRILNNNQLIETTREIAFYNGSVTFYDVNMNEGGVTPTKSLEFRPNYSYNSKSNVQITGKVIVPNAYYDGNDTDLVKEAHPNPLAGIPITYQLTGGASVTGSVYTSVAVTPNNINDAFYVYNYTITNSDIVFTGLADDTNFNLTLLADNEVNKQLNISPVPEGTGELGFSFRDGTKAYIYDVNYLPGYTPSSYEALNGVDMEGANIFSLPFGVEVLIGNPGVLPGGVGSAANPITATNIVGPNGGAGYTPVLNTDYSTKPLTVTTVTRSVNGVTQTFGRVVLEFPKMPNTGTQTIKFRLTDQTNGAAEQKPVTVNLLYGPFANFASAFDGMIIDLDTTITKDIADGASPGSEADQKAYVIYQKLNSLAGEMLNVANSSDIVYTAGATQTVFMYVNNTLIPLVSNGTQSKFKIPDGASTAAALNALFIGENKIKLVFQTARNYYEKVLKINIVPTNLPVIPAPDTSGVFPYSTQYGSVPLANDPNFPVKGSIFSTTHSEMNVYGTFDFIDLGTLDLATVNSKLGGLLAADKLQYMLKITTPDSPTGFNWDLSLPFQVMKNGAVVGVANGPLTDPALTVRYDLDTQTFSFVLLNQKLHVDGTPKIYNMYVYNSGIAGPRASYRLEVDPTSIPYKVIRPVLPAKGIVNQDFIEVIIDAPGAEKVTIKGGTSKATAAEKIDFDSDNDGTPDYPGAYRAFVRGLKPNKANKIEFVITSGADTTKDSINIEYIPTNIPGAGILKAMANSNKVFDGSVSLSFAKGTSLIRKDFNVPSNLKNQVFTGHDLFFAIANPEDGVVDRREYETLPSNFDLILQSFGTRFKVSYPSHFIKSSPVFWIDAGLADDPSSPSYDPLKMGVDPYQFPGAVGPGGATIPTYDDRPENRELITSKSGTLELKYDSSMRDVVGTIITVFRYDVKGKYWDNIGGVVDTKKHTIKVPFSQFGYYVVGKMVYSFNDITQHPYAKNYLEAIYAKGIMNPVSLDQFGADLFTSRGEFARAMVKAIDLPLDYELSKSHFDDVPFTINPDALWDYRYVETAARQGLIRGTSPRSFEPNTNLSREQAAVIIARTLNLKLDTDATKINANLQKLFKDYASIEYYARAAVVAIAKKGFITGTPIDSADPKKGLVFEPKSNLARADTAILVARILADQKRLPKIN